MRGITGWLAVVVVLLLHGGGAGVAADPWQLDGWKARAVVTIAKPLPDASVDSASVRVVHQGRAKPDGSDFRVRDAAGKTVPFQLTWHDPDGYSLISFHAGKPSAGAKFFVYFANPDRKSVV